MRAQITMRGVVTVVLVAVLLAALAWSLNLHEHLGRFLCRNFKRGWLETSGFIACWPE